MRVGPGYSAALSHVIRQRAFVGAAHPILPDLIRGL
jgi:hypothetical protein